MSDEGDKGGIAGDFGASAPADDRLAKRRLALAVNAILEARGYKQAQAARVLGISQPKVSALANLRLDHFSAERLMRFLNSLGQDVEIVIRPGRDGAGRISVFTLS